jgi:hypothetical protein
MDTFDIKTVYARECAAWNNMIQRAKRGEGPPHVEEWNSFDAFIASIGQMPRGSMSIQRANYSQPYGPGNAYWLDSGSVRSNNRIALSYRLEDAEQSEKLFKLMKDQGVDITAALQMVKKSYGAVLA